MTLAEYTVGVWGSFMCACWLQLRMLGAGETQESMKPVLDRLHENGIGSILDYAAEVRTAALSSQESCSTCGPCNVMQYLWSL